MANKEHLDILKQGVSTWNKWREKNPEIKPDISGADLRGVDLREVNLREANLMIADLTCAYLCRADLSKAELGGAKLFNADLSGAKLDMADLSGANLVFARLGKADLFATALINADLSRANLSGANLEGTIFLRANLSNANLSEARLIQTNLEEAILTDCSIYGISAWDLKLKNAKQENLITSCSKKSTIIVDDIEMAQFIYLLVNNERIRHIIDTITSKVVLILGRFTKKRKAILNAIREELRKHNYLPVLFDFDSPVSRDVSETVSTLAHMSRFIIADITDPRSIPDELRDIVPRLAIPVQPLLEGSKRKYGMFFGLKKYPWVLSILRYKNLDDLLTSLPEKGIAPAEAKAKELEKQKRRV